MDRARQTAYERAAMAESAGIEEASEAAGRAVAAPMPLFVLGLACFASNISIRAVDPMLPLIAGQFEVSLHQAAWLATAYGILYALSQPILGPLADAFGKSVVIKICLALLAVSFAACALAPSFATFLIARGISGAVAGGIVPVAFALVGDRVAFAGRQVSISRLVIAVITGQMGGAALSGAIAEFAGWRSVFVVTTIVAAAIAATAFSRLKGEDELRRRFSVAAAAGDYAFLLTDRRALIVYGVVFCEGLFMFGVFPFVAPTLLSRGEGGTLVAGLCIASYALGGLIYGLTARQVIGRLGPIRMMAAGGVVVGICYAIAAAPVPALGLAVLFAFSGFGFYLLHNTLQVLGTELAPEARGAAVALFASFYFMGLGLGPVLSGQISAAFGYGAMFAVSAVLVAALGLIASQLMRRA
jgi:MFS transporter, DHA1 family, inner membrane transport protein